MTSTKNIVGLKRGSVTLKNVCRGFAPSIFAASYRFWFILENPDKKIQAFFQVLIDYHQIPSQTIDKLAHLPEKTILNFKKNPILVTNLGEKYQITYVVMVLRFLFKELEP